MMTETEARLSQPQVVKGSLEYYDTIQQLCDLRYGTGYIDRAVYEKWMEHPELMSIALIDGEFAGFSVFVPATVEELMTHMDMPREDVVRIAGDRPALIYKSAAVPFRFEKRGIMQLLLGSALEELPGLGYGSIFGSAWVYDGRTPMGRLFDHFGFRQLYGRKMLWYHDKNYRCVVCGGQCKCDAMIYCKQL